MAGAVNGPARVRGKQVTYSSQARKMVPSDWGCWQDYTRANPGITLVELAS